MADKLDGSAVLANTIPSNRIQEGSITTTQLQTSLATTITQATHPKIRSITYPGNDTAANTGGGDTITLTGSGFGNTGNVQIYINGNAVSSITVTNANSVSFTAPALAAATYPVYLINTSDGSTAILIPGIQYSGFPSWTTTTPLTTQAAAEAWNIQLIATSDSAVSYSLQSGSSLPAGITLAANGLISGTMTSPPEDETTYNFTVVATDVEQQDASRAFSVSVTVAVLDPYFSYTSLLLHGDGTNNANNNVFTDSSNNNFTITRNGNPTQGAFSPFSPTGWSNYFNGTNSSLLPASNTAFNFGTGDFTVEAWVYQLASGTQCIYDCRGSDASAAGFFFGTISTNFAIYTNGTTAISIPTQINIWIHFAIVRSGSTWTLYKNGISVATYSSSANLSDANRQIGASTTVTSSSANYFNGYISNLRVVKGTAVYTSNFTPSTAPLTAITNTSLLTCQSNRFIDNSTNNFAITRNGDAAVRAFSPLKPSAKYAANTHGGSGFFDGTGDWLDAPANTAFSFGTGNFTIEAWVYPTGTNASAPMPIFEVRSSSTSTAGFAFMRTANALTLNVYQNGYLGASTNSLTLNAWNHVALVRNGNTWTYWINGVSSGSFTNSSNLTDGATNAPKIGGSSTSGEVWIGYMSSYRILKGTALYTVAFTPPTEPLASIANTSLLFNFTNAGIIDSTARSIIETVGDTKVNTAIKKFGTGSMYFDGTGDWLVIPSGELLNVGTGDWTVEAWIYPSNVSGDKHIIGYNNASASDFWDMYLSNATLVFRARVSSADDNTSGGTVSANTWTHVAAVRSSGTIYLYVGGVRVATNDVTMPTIGSAPLGIGVNLYTGGISPWNGYIDDLRVTKGVARYRYNFTPPAKAFNDGNGNLAANTSDVLVGDEVYTPVFPYTSLLLHGDGANNANNHAFLDSSNNNFTITRNGNPSQGTFSPFSPTGWSNYFDGNGDYLNFASNAAFNCGTGDFTVEAWVYINSYSGSYPLIIGNNNGSFSAGAIALTAQNSTSGGASKISLSVYDINSGAVTLAAASINPLASWIHVALVRNGTNLVLYINGNSLASTTISAGVTFDWGKNGLLIGGGNWDAGNSYFAGYISNIRLVKGSALYTSNFTPSTSALTAVANTSLLTCQSNRFIDTSTNAFTITRNGDVSVQAFSPFAPSVEYTANTHGGSAYFDGTGDYLDTSTNSSVFAIGTGQFTVEAWVNTTDTSWALVSSTTSGGLVFGYNIDNGSQGLGIWRAGVGSAATSGVLIPYGSWNHIAVTRDSSNNVRFYLNGTQIGSTTSNTTDFGTGNQVFRVGTDGISPASFTFTGYATNVRVLKGTALYTSSTYTVPTEPLTSIANTSLLCNFTNAGILDSTGKNVLETVNEVKANTTTKKYGTGSIAFDGTDDYLLLQASPLLEFGDGDFTIEFWWYPTSTARQALYHGSFGTDWSVGIDYSSVSTNQKIGIWASSNGTSWNLINSDSGGNGIGVTTITQNAWNHIAYVRRGTTWMLFVNGNRDLNLTGISGSIVNRLTSRKAIGAWFNTTAIAEASGYMDEFRITRGIARYVQPFTPPTAAFLNK